MNNMSLSNIKKISQENIHQGNDKFGNSVKQCLCMSLYIYLIVNLQEAMRAHSPK